MAAKKVGTLIKEARMGADMTQEQLARRIAGLSASDISLAERNKMELTQAQLRQIAKATGVTQASLLNAAKGTASRRSAPAKRSSSAAKSSMRVTAAEKRLVELYRKADADARRAALKELRGEDSEIESLLEDIMDAVQDIFDS